MPDSLSIPFEPLAHPIVFTVMPVGEVDDLAAIWRDLEARADVTFYLTWDWIGHWLAEIDAECYAVIGRLDHKIVALAILTHATYRRHGILKLNALLLHETGKSDNDVITIEYNGILTDRSVADQATVGCLRFLQGPEVAAAIGGGWDEIRFGGVAQSFERYLEATGLRVWQLSTKPSWAVDLEAVRRSGLSYLDHVSANTRYQVRRALRLYEQRGPVTATRAQTVEEAMQFYAAMQELHQRYWIAKGEPGSYAFPFYKRVHERILTDCIPRGTVEIVRVSAGEAVIGYVYNFIARGWVCAYHTGFAYESDPKLKPGLVSHYLCIERHLKEGAKCYDFLAGDNRYKANLGTRGPDMMNLVLQRRILKIGVEHALREVKTWARSSRSLPQPAADAAEDLAEAKAQASRGKVLVLGDDTRSFLTIVRSLGRRGIEVHVAPFNRRSAALKSRYIAKVHKLPSYVDGGAGWVAEMKSLLARERYDLVIPCDDRTLLPLSAHRKKFAKSAMLAIPDPGSVAVLFDKGKTKSLAASLGVNLARTLLPEDCADPEEVFRLVGSRVVVKPKHSYQLNTLFKRGVVRIADSPAELIQITDELPRNEFYFEGYFPGSGVGLSVLADKGEILLAFQHHRVHESEGGGASAYRVSAPISPELKNASEKMLGALSYTGLAMFEFRRNFSTGDWILLEVNARPWGSIPLPVGLGVDFPFAWYRLLVNGQRPAKVGYRSGVFGRNLVLDVYHLTRQLSESRNLLQSTRIAADWARSFWPLFVLRERSDTIVWDDILPGVSELVEFAQSAFSRVERRTPGFLSLQNALARRRVRGVARAAKANDRSISVLFLCHGNICRSAFAELVMTKLVSGTNRRISVASAGTMPVNGRVSPAEAIDAARRFGVELGGHRSRYADDELLAATDIVFYYDDNNIEALQTRGPRLKPATVRLALMAGDGDNPWEITDPYGRDHAFYDRTFARIERAVRVVHDLISVAL
jgi:protein-tyrosine-phosphatase/predicted ATP-grasp superfamily ATP-dependent carboligase/CelD/BcsL family acetyltransferase involved in cellulose biosynthesis